MINNLPLMFAYVALSSFAGICISAWFPWREELRGSAVPRAVGLLVGPFLVGLIGVAILALPFQKSVGFFVYAPLAILAVPAFFGWRARKAMVPNKAPVLLGVWLLYLLLIFWTLALVFNAVTYPLTQNDALEYATVGRLLFETGSLSSYPAISPETSKDGFYGPWTHPPLYVAMVALTNFIQGHADEPGLMRLIAPWFLLSATYATWALGSLINRRVGALAALIVISTPLMFLGADSALLDAITVASFVLLLAALAGFDFQKRRAGIAFGFIIGLGMWAHSQTILYLPVGLFLLVLITGFKPRSGFWRTASTTVLAALIIASPPYLRNLSIMGALISDEPAVFALEMLDWRGYFDFARGLDHPVAVIQYGLFKGWFSLEAYGLSYWFMTIGLCFVLKGAAFPARAFLAPRHLSIHPGQTLLWTTVALFACYFGGTLMSVLLGMNLMIKNERYLLTTLPAVALIGAYGLDRLSVWLTERVTDNQKGWRDMLLALLLTAEVFALSSFLIVGFYYRFRLLPPEQSIEINWDTADVSVLDSDKHSFLGKSFRPEQAFRYFPSIRSVEYMNDTLPDGSLVLAARPADFYYLKHKMLSYLDLRLLPVYQETDPKRAVQMLREIGVTHLHMVDYSLPPFYNSVVADILADPALSTLVYDTSFFQIYTLDPSPFGGTPSAEVFTPGPEEAAIKWATRTRYLLGGRKSLSSTGGIFTLLNGDGISQKTFPFFHRDYTTFLMPTELNTRNLRIPLFFDIKPGFEYALEYELEGHGYIRLWAEIYGVEDGILRSGNDNPRMRVTEFVLDDEYPRKKITRRFRAADWAERMTPQIEHTGKSRVRILSARLIEFGVPVPDGAKPMIE